MRNRWLTICRRLVPAALRERVFDPTVHDLDARRAARLERGQGWTTGVTARIAWTAAVLLAAMQCRWLGPAALAAIVPAPASAGDGFWIRAAGDVRLALRRARRQPVFAIFAIATLAFGIGANIAVFSFVNAYVLAPLPLPNAGSLVRVCGHSPSRPCDIVSYPTYADLRDGTPGLDLAAHIVATVNVGPDTASESRPVELVTGNYFRVTQVQPILGRVLDARDDVSEMAHPVVVLGEAYWRAREGARTDVIGRSLLMNGAPYEVVGIVPASFHGTQGVNGADLWAPIMMQQQLRPRSQKLTARGWSWLRTVGRLAPGTSLAVAQQELDRVGADLARRFPSKGDATTYVASPALALEDSERRALAPYASLTLALTTVLLIVTCANLAGLMQARAIGRRREQAIRQSLGAGRGRLLAEWLTECVTLALAGGIAGFALARGLAILVAQSPPPPALVGSASLNMPADWRVAAFAVGVSLLAALLVGLPAARRVTSIGVADALKDEGTSSTGGRRGLRLRRATVLVQVTAAAMLLVGSGLLLTSLRNLRTFDPGFAADQLAGLRLDLSAAHLIGASADAYTSALLERVRALPGVASADLVSNVPLTPNHDRSGFRIPGYLAPDGSAIVSLDYNVVGAAYFETIGVPFVGGRPWTAGERAAVINETMARRFWPDGPAVGQAIELVGQGSLMVAGVIRDSAYYEVGETPMPFVFLPAEVAKPSSYTLVARTSGPPQSVVTGLVDAARATDARVRREDPGTFGQWREAELYPQRLTAWATAAFAGIALLLTAIGLFGVVSTAVAMRTREIGIRMALGARPNGVLAAVLRESLALVMAGAGAGFVLVYASAGLLRQWLFGVSRFDAGVYALVAMLLTAMTLVAAGLPARRAANVDPVRALRT